MSDSGAFSQTANPDSYVSRPATDQCLGDLENWAFAGRTGIAVVAGAPGIGKTLMLRMLAARTKGRFESVYIPNPIFNPAEIALWALESLKVPREDDPSAALVRTAISLRREGSGLLLLVDDVEMLPTETQKWLFDIARDTAHAVRTVLSVMDEDRAAQLMAIAEGEAQFVRLEGAMSLAETTEYVRSELQRNGVDPEVCARFDQATVAEIHARAGGVPIRVQAESAAILRDDVQERLNDNRTLTLGTQILSVGRSSDAPDPLPSEPVVAPIAAAPVEATPVDPEADVGVERAAEPSRISSWASWTPLRSTGVQVAAAFVAGIIVMAGLDGLRGAGPSAPATSPSPPVTEAPSPVAPAVEEVVPIPTREVDPAAPSRAPVSAALPPVSAGPPERRPVEPSVREEPAAKAPEPAQYEVAAVAPAKTPAPAASPPVAAVAPVLVGINARPWATIWIDGVRIGETPLAEVAVPPGRHTVAAHLPGGRVVEQTVDISADRRFLRFE